MDTKCHVNIAGAEETIRVTIDEIGEFLFPSMDLVVLDVVGSFSTTVTHTRLQSSSLVSLATGAARTAAKKPAAAARKPLMLLNLRRQNATVAEIKQKESEDYCKQQVMSKERKMNLTSQ